MKRLLFLVCFVVFIFMFYGSVSFALTASEWQADCREKLQTLTNKGLLSIENISNVNLNQFTAYGTNNCYGYFIIVGHGNNNSYSPQLSTSNELYICSLHTNGNITNHTNSTNNTMYNDWKVGSGGTPNGARYTLSGGKLADGNFGFNNLVDGFYCYTTTAINTRVLTLSAGEEYGGSYIISRFGINLLTSNIINSYKGQSNVYSYYYTYNNNNWLLGEIEGLDEVDEVEIKLNHYDSDRRIATWYKSNLIDDKFSVNGSLIYRNDLYFIDFDAYKNGQIVDTGRFWVTFMPPGTVISNGEIVSIGSGDDYNVQNSTNDIISYLNDSGDVSGFISDISSSGDLLQRFGYQTYDSNFITFISDMFASLRLALYDDTDISFTFDYMGKTMTIHSSDFYVEPGLIKGFCSTFLTFGYIVLVYQQIRKFYFSLQEGDVNKVLSSTDVDDTTIIM